MGAFENCRTVDNVLDLLHSMRQAGTLTLSHELMAELRLIELQSNNLPTDLLNNNETDTLNNETDTQNPDTYCAGNRARFHRPEQDSCPQLPLNQS